MKKSEQDWIAIQEKAQEKFERDGASAVYAYGNLLYLNMSYCSGCNAETHDVGNEDDERKSCLICGGVKTEMESRPAWKSQEHRRHGTSMIVERIDGMIFEITPGACEIKDCDGIENGFNLVAVFDENDQSKCIVFGSISNAFNRMFVNTRRMPAHINCDEHELINLQRMAEQAFTFEELINNWNNA